VFKFTVFILLNLALFYFRFSYAHYVLYKMLQRVVIDFGGAYKPIITARSGESLSFSSLAATRATHNNEPKREGCLHCGGKR
jgi:hypothetical protein